MTYTKEKRRNIPNCERSAILKAWKNKCAYCKGVEGPFAIDHIIPFVDGGTCDIENLCLSCVKCNSMKSDTRLPKMYEGLLLSVAKRKAKKVRKLIEDVSRINRLPKQKRERVYIPSSDGGVWTTSDKDKVSNVISILDTMLSRNLLTDVVTERYDGHPPREWLVCEDLGKDFFQSLCMTPKEVADILFSFCLESTKEGHWSAYNLTESWRTSLGKEAIESVSFNRPRKDMITFISDMKNWIGEMK